MDDKLVQIKKQILDELGYLSYMEKKKVRDDHDQIFIEKELRAIKKRKKINIVSVVFLTLALICAIMSMFFDSNPIISSRNIIGTLAFILIFVFNVFLYSSQLIENTKREILYKILSVFNKENRNGV